MRALPSVTQLRETVKFVGVAGSRPAVGTLISGTPMTFAASHPACVCAGMSVSETSRLYLRHFSPKVSPK